MSTLTTTTVGVRFKPVTEIEYYEAAFPLERGDLVVVEAARGTDIGMVEKLCLEIPPETPDQPTKSVLRKATPQDLERKEEFVEKARMALSKCKAMVAEANLPMILLSSEYNLEGSHLTFFFSADGRVDFRSLVKDLASTFRTRVELRQVNPRERAKIVGGLGRCGRVLCCSLFLTTFSQITMKMAENQNLPLVPDDRAGVCGRLRCCLRYENDQYTEMRGELPKQGNIISTPRGAGVILGYDLLRGVVKVRLQNEETTSFPVSELGLGSNSPQSQGCDQCPVSS